MRNYFEKVKNTALFKEIDDRELALMLECLGSEAREFRKNSVILCAGGKPHHIGIVISGLLHIVKDDYEGNRTLVAPVQPGEVFGESLCCANIDESPVTVLAAEESKVLLLKYERMTHICQTACDNHRRLIENMLELVASKNVYLQGRLEIMSFKSIRAKILHYLESLALKQGRAVVIPFNQTKLAEYLCVDRSALAHELARMKKDGLIDYEKNSFTLRVPN